jgi:thiol:disulfide interchange protein
MGLLLLAAAAYFVGSGLIALVSDYPYLGKKLHWWAVASFGALAGGLLAVRTVQITKSPVRRAVFVLVGVVIGGLAVMAAWNTTVQAAYEYANKETSWQDYSPELLERALGEERIVVMDFTAEWCLNCKALKATVLNREPVKGVLQSDDVVMIRADLTSRKAPGWEKLRSLGETGIPLLVVYGPGTAEPWKSNAYSSQQVLEAIERAKGGEGLAEAR